MGRTDSGWIKLHRKIKRSEIWGKPNLVYFWVWCLTTASHDDYSMTINGERIKLKAGHFIFGKRAAARETGLSESTCYRYVNELKMNRMLNLKVNHNYTIATVVNWRLYQGDVFNGEPQSEPQVEPKVNQKRTKNGHKQEIYKGDKKIAPLGADLSQEKNEDDFISDDGTFDWSEEE